MLVVQNERRPNAIQNALLDLMRCGLSEVRVCSAYMSRKGSEILFDAIRRSTPDDDQESIPKTIVTSLDFGTTEPAALHFWQEKANCRVLVAGAASLERGSLVPRTAFHPKLYVFNQRDGALAGLVGSANLTNRGLTINSEVAWSGLSGAHWPPEKMQAAWNAAVQPAIPLTASILEQYQVLRNQAPSQPRTEELAPVPTPILERSANYGLFRDAAADLSEFGQLWIQSLGMQGGAKTQLELPRGAHRFFGANFKDYQIETVGRIAEPKLVSGRRTWSDRALTWHGDNRMERINLPSQAMGGFRYEHSLILFRRLADNAFELRAHPKDSDSARAYVEASHKAGLLFRVGKNSNRLVGLVP